MRSATLTSFFAMACLGSLATCGSGSDDGNLLVTVTGLPPRATKLSMKAELNGTAAPNAQQVTPTNGRFGVVLPAGTTGHFVLNIQALDADGCLQATGKLDTTLTGKYTEQAVTFTAQSPRMCGTLSCAAGTICSYLPKPYTDNLWGVWATSPTDVWAVGDNSRALHYDGTNWRDTVVPIAAQYYGVWGSSANDVWAVGQLGAIIHYNGTVWSSSSVSISNDFMGVYGTSAANVWAVGTSSSATSAGEFWRWDTISWKKVPNTFIGTLNSVWASAPNDVIAAGAGGLLVHYDGSTTASMPSGTTMDLRNIWGLNRNLVFAAGVGGTVVRNSGTGFQASSVANYNATLYGIAGDASTIYGVGNVGANGNMIKGSAPFDMFGVQSSGSTAALTGITIGSNGIAWVVGKAGYLGYFDTRP